MKRSIDGGCGELRGSVFQIQRWSVHDGDGIRSTVFLQGCPLRCAWCANPESWAVSAESDVGRRVSVENLLTQLRRDEVFYRESGGGVTFSGGEPLAQPDFLRALLQACASRGYDTAIESSAFCDWEESGDIFSLPDALFIDIKHMDAGRHEKFTGVSNTAILRNVERILTLRGNVVIRVPLVSGVNDDDKNILELCRFLKGAAGLKGIEFLPYHELGVSKYASLGLPSPAFAAPSVGTVERLKALLRDRGLMVIEY